jgi:hypothetical protein
MTVVLVEVPASESGQGTSVLVHELAVSSNVGHLVFKGEGEISNDVRVSVEIRNGLVGKAHGVATAVALKGLGGGCGNEYSERAVGGNRKLTVQPNSVSQSPKPGKVLANNST